MERLGWEKIKSEANKNQSNNDVPGNPFPSCYPNAKFYQQHWSIYTWIQVPVHSIILPNHHLKEIPFFHQQ
jgi:hypothetical protein